MIIFITLVITQIIFICILFSIDINEGNVTKFVFGKFSEIKEITIIQILMMIIFIPSCLIFLACTHKFKIRK